MHPSCVSPPELDESQLLKHLDGEADEQATRHLAACAHCRRRADDLRAQQAGLQALLHRFDCPSALELGEYITHDLSKERSQFVASHLAGCPHCTRELQDLQRPRGSFTVRPEIHIEEGLRVQIARLLSGRLPGSRPGLEPAVLGIRGGQEESYAYYEAEDVVVAVEVSDDPARSNRRSVLGLADGILPPGLKAHLLMDDRTVATTPVDAQGHFRFEDLAPGRYALILSGTGMEVHIQTVEV